MTIGGGIGPEGTAFGKLAAKVPARRAPEAVRRLAELYLANRADGETPDAYFRRALEQAKAALAPLEELRLEDARPEDFIEPGASEPFRPETQSGECAA